MNFNMFFNLCWIWSKKASISSFYKEKNFKPCLTKQLLNMFKLWCGQGIRVINMPSIVHVMMSSRLKLIKLIICKALSKTLTGFLLILFSPGGGLKVPMLILNLNSIHRSGGRYPPLSPTLRWIIVIVYTTQAE